MGILQPVFVLTTNADGQFFRVFPRGNVCAFQGDFGFCQCSQPCRDEVIPNGEMIQEMTAKNPGAFYACLNQKESSAPAHLKDKSLYISGDLAEVLPLLGEALREKAGSHNKKQED